MISIFWNKIRKYNNFNKTFWHKCTLKINNLLHTDNVPLYCLQINKTYQVVPIY